MAISAQELFDQLISGETSALAKSITLMESRLDTHRQKASELLDMCMSKSGNSVRVAVTGVPGVGKSTFIDAFGHYLITEHQKKVAVLAVDPSSKQSRGSILGDKTRMTRLSLSDGAFVRPSPSGDSLGGVAAQTRESILLCEAAGYDVILVETVGVGQSETLVHNMVDFFLLLLLPGAGDELQGIKRGIVEMADGIAINKSDTSPKLAKDARVHYKNALQLIHNTRENWQVELALIDSLSGNNISAVWEMISDFVEVQTKSGGLTKNRKQQAQKWFDEQLGDLVLHAFHTKKELKEKKAELDLSVGEGEISPRAAAQVLVDFALNG